MNIVFWKICKYLPFSSKNNRKKEIQNLRFLENWPKLFGLLGCAISRGSTYVRLGDHRPYVVGADQKSHVGGGRAGGG